MQLNFNEYESSVQIFFFWKVVTNVFCKVSFSLFPFTYSCLWICKWYLIFFFFSIFLKSRYYLVVALECLKDRKLECMTHLITVFDLRRVVFPSSVSTLCCGSGYLLVQIPGNSLSHFECVLLFEIGKCTMCGKLLLHYLVYRVSNVKIPLKICFLVQFCKKLKTLI